MSSALSQAQPENGQPENGQPEDGQPFDGRLLRGARTRNAIVQSYIELLGSGERAPNAEQIARHAGVGIRTVYNQFRDLEGVRAEAGVLVRARIEDYALHAASSWPAWSSLRDELELDVSQAASVLPLTLDALLRR